MIDFECACGRKQSYAPPGISGGITESEAVIVGWEQDGWGDWHCPFCAGNEDKLKAIFSKHPDCFEPEWQQ
jgi:hypothetical protein